MAGPILYSANPWIAHDIAVKYLGGRHFAWVCEYFDSNTAPAGSAGGAIAPSSNPKAIYERLAKDVELEDTHSDMIQRYKKTLKRLSAQWLADNVIAADQRAEIVAVVGSKSWKIWRPVLYTIPKALIVPTDRITYVPHRNRAAYGPEMQIVDLMPHEFDIIEFKP